MKIGVFLSDFFQKKDYEMLFNDYKYYIFPNSYIGLRSVLDDTKQNIEMCFSINNFDDYDFIFYSVTSHQDIELAIKYFPRKRKCKIIVGGSGVINPVVLYNIADIIVLGRCDNQILDILNGIYDSNVIVVENDKLFEKEYTIGVAKKKINIDHGGKDILFNEKSYGCKYKCNFCHYSWSNKFVNFSDNENNYESGYNDNEDVFIHFKWRKARYQVSAIDGVSEESRKIANKNISNDQIKNILLSRDNMLSYDNSFQLKLYNIIGYSWEKNYNKYYYKEIDDILKYVDEKIKGKICILLNNTHFIPMPLTPFENMPLNTIDFKKIEYSFSGGKIKLIKSYAGYGLKMQKKNLITYRLKLNDLDLYEKKINNLPEYFEKYIIEQDSVIPNIKRHYNMKIF